MIKAQTLGSGRTTEKVHPNVCREVTAEVVGPRQGLMTGLWGDWMSKERTEKPQRQ